MPEGFIRTRHELDHIAATCPVEFMGQDTVDDLLATARAYHDLRDAVLTLHVPMDTVLYGARTGLPFTACDACGDDYPCPSVQAVARVDGSGNGAGAVADGAP